MTRDEFTSCLMPHVSRLDDVGHGLHVSTCDDCVLIIGHHDFGATQVAVVDHEEGLTERWEFIDAAELTAKLNEIFDDRLPMDTEQLVAKVQAMSEEDRRKVVQQIDDALKAIPTVRATNEATKATV